MKTKVKEMKSEIDENKRIISQKDEEIYGFNTKIKNMTNEIDTLKQKINTNNMESDEIQRLKSEIKIKNDLPKIINELKFVVLSDIHVSGLIGRKKMKYLAEVVNQLKPDIIFITGDLMDGSVNQLKKEISLYTL